MSIKFNEIIDITGKIKIKYNYWTKINFSLIKDLCFNLEEKFNLVNLDLEIKYHNKELLYKIKLNEIDEIKLKKYLHSYGSILLRQKPINLLFEGEALINFKQSLDLSLLELKLLKKELDQKELENQEIHEIHYNFGQSLIEYSQLT